MQLLERSPERRLGSSLKDAEEIKAHAFFKDVKWDDVLNKKIPVPFVPTVRVRTYPGFTFGDKGQRKHLFLTPLNACEVFVLQTKLSPREVSVVRISFNHNGLRRFVSPTHSSLDTLNVMAMSAHIEA